MKTVQIIYNIFIANKLNTSMALADAFIAMSYSHILLKMT